MALTPVTELEAVNQMLAAIGESPVSSLDDSGLVTAIQARSTLTEVSRAVQGEGWHWNSDVEYAIAPTVDGELMPPSNTLALRLNARSAGHDVVQRGSRLWDRKNQTFTFTQTLFFDIVVGLAFDDLPEPARRYIAMRAARVFVARHTNSDTQGQNASQDEIMARAELERAENRSRRPNILDSEDTRGVLIRSP